MQRKFILIFILFFIVSIQKSKAEESTLNRDSVLYKKSWSAGIRLRSDGFTLGAEITIFGIQNK